MNSAINNLFNDIFSNAFNFGFPSNSGNVKLDTQFENFWGDRGRLIAFFDHFKATDDGKDFERWLPKKYSMDDFIKEYKGWFSFYYYFQVLLNRKKKFREDSGTVDEFVIHFDQRLILFQPLFLTLPFIFYLKRILKINYFYIYFIDFNEPSVYSVFKELENFKCYFPWYSGFTLLDNFNLKKGIDNSNKHLIQYINNFLIYKEAFISSKKYDMNFAEDATFIRLSALTKNKITSESEVKAILTNEKVFEEYEETMNELLNIKKSIESDLFYSVCLNYCLQDSLDKLLESVREKDLPKTNKIFTYEKFSKIIEKNAYMYRPYNKEREYNEDVYYYSPGIDIFAFHKIISKEYPDSSKPHMYEFLKELISNNQEINRNLMLTFLYLLEKDEIKANIEIVKVFDDIFGPILNTKNSKIDLEFEKTLDTLNVFLKEKKILENINGNLKNIFSPFVFRNNIEKEFARFDYGFIGLRMSDLRYILEKKEEFRNQSDVFYEIHGVFSFLPLETVSNEFVKKRNFRVKNFMGSFIDVFTTEIVSKKMSEIAKKIGEGEGYRALYGSQSHEIKRLLRYIRKTTPAVILEDIVNYFATIFAVEDADINDYDRLKEVGDCSEHFLGGDNLQDFVKNSIQLALRIETSSIILRDKGYSNILEMGEEGVRNLLKKEMDQAFETYIDNQVPDNIPVNIVPVGIEDDNERLTYLKPHWYFFSAMMSAFRNAVRHTGKIKDNNKNSIIVKLEAASRLIRIENTSKSAKKRDKEYENEPVQIGTETSLKNYFTFYDHKKAHIDTKDNRVLKIIGDMEDGYEKWLTLVPLPDIIELKKDDNGR